MLVTALLEQGAGQVQAIDSIDGAAPAGKFVATAREKELHVTTVGRSASKQACGNHQG
jgi:hypothetical protein